MSVLSQVIWIKMCCIVNVLINFMIYNLSRLSKSLVIIEDDYHAGKIIRVYRK